MYIATLLRPQTLANIMISPLTCCIMYFRAIAGLEPTAKSQCFAGKKCIDTHVLPTFSRGVRHEICKLQ